MELKHVNWHGILIHVLVDEDGVLDIGDIQVENKFSFIQYLESEKSTCLEDITESLKAAASKPAPLEEEDDLPVFEPMEKPSVPSFH